MVNYCVAFNSSDVHLNVMFHKFPDSVKDKIRHDKWVYLLKPKNFKPSSYSRLCSKHFIESDYLPPVISGPLRLKKDAVPSVFDLPDHLLSKKPRERRPLVQIIPNEIQPHPITDTEGEDQHELKMLNFLASKYLLLRIYTQCKKATADHLGGKQQLRQYLRHTTLFLNT